MERLLNEGLNYTMGTDKTCSQVFPDDRQSNNCANEETCHQYLLDVPKIKLQSTVESPPMTPSISKNYKGVNVANKSSVKKKTKIPIAPTFALNKPTPKAVLTPTNLKYTLPKPSPAHVNPKRRFKDIESPISLYIKNSGVAPLFKKITPSKQLNSDNGKSVRKQQERSNDKENSLVFPEVIYKPAKKTIVKECSDFKLPKNIESLIPQKPNVIRHERHVGGGSKLNQSFISKKLCEPDITIDSSTSLDSTGDISVHCAKRVFITKNSFK